MKKNRLMKVAALLLALTLMTSCFVGGTFAKYTSKATGSATAKIALWDVRVGDSAKLDSVAKEFTFNLFDTINDTLGGGDETDVADGHIAPGTTGSVTITITNSSEVNVDYTVALNVPAALEGIVTFTASPNSGSLNMTDNKTVDITITWVWPYYEDADADIKDTELGVIGADNMEFTATVTVTQKD